MPRGYSGRIVIEVDPHLKDKLYMVLAQRGLTLKAWFISEAERIIEADRQAALLTAEPDLPSDELPFVEGSNRGSS